VLGSFPDLSLERFVHGAFRALVPPSSEPEEPLP
jgi:hypothetical protein